METALDRIGRLSTEITNKIQEAPSARSIAAHCICVIQVGKFPDGITKQRLEIPTERAEEITPGSGPDVYRCDVHSITTYAHTEECEEIMLVQVRRQKLTAERLRYEAMQALTIAVNMLRVHFTATNAGNARQKIIFLNVIVQELKNCDRAFHILYPSETEQERHDCPVADLIGVAEGQIELIASASLAETNAMMKEIPAHLVNPDRSMSKKPVPDNPKAPVVPLRKGPGAS